MKGEAKKKDTKTTPTSRTERRSEKKSSRDRRCKKQSSRRFSRSRSREVEKEVMFVGRKTGNGRQLRGRRTCMRCWSRKQSISGVVISIQDSTRQFCLKPLALGSAFGARMESHQVPAGVAAFVGTPSRWQGSCPYIRRRRRLFGHTFEEVAALSLAGQQRPRRVSLTSLHHGAQAGCAHDVEPGHLAVQKKSV